MSAFMVPPCVSRLGAPAPGIPGTAPSLFKAIRPECIPSAVRCRALGDLGQELGVGLGGPDLVHEQLEPGGSVALGGQGVQDPAKLPDLLELAPVEEELLVPG